MIRQEDIKPGDYLSWEIPHDGWYTVKVTYVDRFRISYDEADGYPSYREATIWWTLQESLDRWGRGSIRKATPEEKAAYDAAQKTYILSYH